MNNALDTLFSIGTEGVFYLVLCIFIVHVCFLGYHWFSYGEKQSVALIALATYLIGAAIFFITMAVMLAKI